MGLVAFFLEVAEISTKKGIGKYSDIFFQLRKTV